MKYEKGKIVTGFVTGIEKYGAFLNLDEYYNGLIHISEVSKNFVRNIEDYVNVGETIRVKVVDVDDENHRVKLSIKDIDYRINRKKMGRIKETTTSFSTLDEKLDLWVNDKYNEIPKKDN